jgi:putative endonuclease
VLPSKNDEGYYIDHAKNLKLRFDQQNKGDVESTKVRRPFDLIYYEACLDRNDASKREKYLKTYDGKMYLKKRLKSYLTGLKGKGRYSRKEFKQFLYIARGSLYETMTLLEIFRRVKWIKNRQYNKHEISGKEIASMIMGLVKSIH